MHLNHCFDSVFGKKAENAKHTEMRNFSPAITYVFRPNTPARPSCGCASSKSHRPARFGDEGTMRLALCPLGQLQPLVQLLLKLAIAHLLEDVGIPRLVDLEGFAAVGADDFVHGAYRVCRVSLGGEHSGHHAQPCRGTARNPAQAVNAMSPASCAATHVRRKAH